MVWFKATDLRVHDHGPLLAAHADRPVLHLYVKDPTWRLARMRHSLKIAMGGEAIFACLAAKMSRALLRFSSRRRCFEARG